jgi:hypothetical protein
MTFSATITGHAANPSEEQAIRLRLRELVRELNDEDVMDVQINAATFSGSYGSEDFLDGAEPIAPIGPGEFEDEDE